MTSIAALHNGPSANSSKAYADWLSAGILLGLVLAVRGIWFGDPVPDFDEQLYSFIGWRMQYGELPFVDWWDRKPFGLFAIFGLSHWLFGPDPIAYQLVAAGFAFATAWLTYDCGKLLVDRVSALMAAAITVMLLSAYANYSGQSEVFFAPIMLGMLRLLAQADHPGIERRAMFAMLLGGLALQIKYTVLPQCIGFGLYALWLCHRRGAQWPRLLATATLYAVLGLLPTALVAIFYAAMGEFEAFTFANFVSFFDRAPASQGRWQSSHAILTLPLVFLSLGGIYAALRMTPPRNRQLWLLIAGWCVAALASVLLPQTVYGYYYAAMAAPAALLALPLLDRSGPGKGVVGLLLVLGSLAILSLPERRAVSLEERAAADRLALAIGPHVDAQTCLWVYDGPTALYRMTNSCVPTRFVYPDHLNNVLEANALGINQAQEVARILATNPGAIVTADEAVAPQNEESGALVKAALAQSYRRVAAVEMHKRTVIAWVRKD